MTCHCGKTALYRVGEAGYCKDHYAEAVEAQRLEKTKSESRAGLNQYQILASRKAANR